MASRRLPLATGVFFAFVTAAGIVVIACGFDGEGTKELPAVPGDTSPLPEASPIHLPDAMGLDGATEADAKSGCTSMLGPVMVHVADAGYCIDSTEVTNEQYDAFLVATSGGLVDAGIPQGGLPPQCAGHAGFGRKPFDEPDGGLPNFPVSRVQWCDAYAYCAWSGKRLCGGRVGGADGGSGEYYAVCSNFGTRDFPYPGKDPSGLNGAYDAAACNVNNLSGAPRQVETQPGCQGGIPGLFDMSGNVEEFVDGCDASQCPAAGGSYYLSDRDSKCSALRFFELDASTDKIYPSFKISAGFRCCASE